MPKQRSTPWRRDSNQTASGKPGAVHPRRRLAMPGSASTVVSWPGCRGLVHATGLDSGPLADLATLARTTITTAIAPLYPLTVLTHPTPIQQKAFDLLGVKV